MLCPTPAVIVFTVLWVTSCAKRPVFVNEWAVKVTGGPHVAQRLALDLGFQNYGEILPDSGEYHFKVPHRRKRSLAKDRFAGRQFALLPEVVSARQLEATVRAKRVPPLAVKLRRNAAGLPLDAWHLNLKDAKGMRVRGAWDLGFSGRGTRVAVVDDGIEYDHPDLKGNFDPDCSIDIVDNDRDPWPIPTSKDPNTHGTRCAGEVASRLSSNCSAGIAFNAHIGGIRLIHNDDHNDAKEARALSFNRDYIDIYTNSWGPSDSGKVFGGPQALAHKALKEGVEKGRRGKGNIFIWAVGNGGGDGDDCNADGYCSSIYTITIASASESKRKPSFSETCASILATTFSSGDAADRAIVTTDVRHGCTAYHTGSSASAPLAAGLVALALEANRNLTWRDVQHIVVRASRPAGLQATTRWNTNGAGRRFSQEFGFGLMDALGMVRLAKEWKTVPKQESLLVVGQLVDNRAHLDPLEFIFEVNNSSPVTLLEHIVVPIDGSCCQFRGLHKFTAISPSGTKSTLLSYRKRDQLVSPFTNKWPLMSVHFWGENPIGTWKIQVQCYASQYKKSTLQISYLGLYGTSSFHNEEGREAEESTFPLIEDQKPSLPLATTETPKSAVTDSFIGCVSHSLTCSPNATDCLTGDHLPFARLFCGCFDQCLRAELVTGRSEILYKLVCRAHELPPAKLKAENDLVCNSLVKTVFGKTKEQLIVQ